MSSSDSEPKLGRRGFWKALTTQFRGEIGEKLATGLRDGNLSELPAEDLKERLDPHAPAPSREAPSTAVARPRPTRSSNT